MLVNTKSLRRFPLLLLCAYFLRDGDLLVLCVLNDVVPLWLWVDSVLTCDARRLDMIVLTYILE